MSLDVYLYLPKKCPHCGEVLEQERVYSANITHNLNTMAEAAGIYMHLWRPEELGITKAHELVGELNKGLARLLEDPDTFKKYNPSNGWGCYDNLVEFVRNYGYACTEFPKATVEVSR
jgi:hypothetical protein